MEEMADLVLGEMGYLNSEQHIRRMEINAELFRIMEEEELYWFRRSHEKCILKGGV
jgi:hypothetical protein